MFSLWKSLDDYVLLHFVCFIMEKSSEKDIHSYKWAFFYVKPQTITSLSFDSFCYFNIRNTFLVLIFAPIFDLRLDFIAPRFL